MEVTIKDKHINVTYGFERHGFFELCGFLRVIIATLVLLGFPVRTIRKVFDQEIHKYHLEEIEIENVEEPDLGGTGDC